MTAGAENPLPAPPRVVCCSGDSGEAGGSSSAHCSSAGVDGEAVFRSSGAGDLERSVALAGSGIARRSGTASGDVAEVAEAGADD